MINKKDALPIAMPMTAPSDKPPVGAVVAAPPVGAVVAVVAVTDWKRSKYYVMITECSAHLTSM